MKNFLFKNHCLSGLYPLWYSIYLATYLPIYLPANLRRRDGPWSSFNVAEDWFDKQDHKSSEIEIQLDFP